MGSSLLRAVFQGYKDRELRDRRRVPYLQGYETVAHSVPVNNRYENKYYFKNIITSHINKYTLVIVMAGVRSFYNQPIEFLRQPPPCAHGSRLKHVATDIRACHAPSAAATTHAGRPNVPGHRQGLRGCMSMGLSAPQMDLIEESCRKLAWHHLHRRRPAEHVR